MFFDSAAWPPPPDGHEPRPPVPRLTPTAERLVMRTVALVLVTMVLGPLAGSSVIEGIVALFR